MMIKAKKINTINDVRRFTLGKDSLWWNSSSKIFNQEKGCILDSKIHLQTIKYENSCFFISDNEGNSYLFEKNLIKFLKEVFILKILNENFLLAETLKGTELFDIKSEKYTFLFEDRIFYYTVENNILYYKDKQLIYAYSFDSNEILWAFDNLVKKYNWMQKSIYEGEPEEEKQAEVIKFLGVYKNELWLVLNNGALLALDIETGTESRYIKEGKMIVGESDYEDFKGYFGYDTVIDEENGLIFNLSRHFYLEYNLKSDNSYFDSYSFKESSLKNQLNLNYIGGFDEKYIYSYEGSSNNRFAIFSRAKKEIIWSSEIEEVKGKFPAIRDLQYGAEKIYVLDHDNTLHIFEKE